MESHLTESPTCVNEPLEADADRADMKDPPPPEQADVGHSAALAHQNDARGHWGRQQDEMAAVGLYTGPQGRNGGRMRGAIADIDAGHVQPGVSDHVPAGVVLRVKGAVEIDVGLQRLHAT